MKIEELVTAIFILICIVALPIGGMVFLRKKGGKVKEFLIGAVTFIVFAMVLEQLLHSAVLFSPAGQVIQDNLWLYALYGGLAAGLFEETGRLVAFRFILKGEKTTTALSYGLGHGGIEAVIVVGVNMVMSIVLAFMLTSGVALQPEMAEVAEKFLATPASTLLWALFERLYAIGLHINNSLLVFTAVRQKRYGLYGFAILAHAGINMLAGLLNGVLPIYATELIAASATAVVFGISLWLIKRGKKREA